MKKIYLLLIIVFCFLFTGCSAKYNLTITGSSIKENIVITETSSQKLNTKYDSLGNVTLKQALQYRSQDVFPAFTYTVYDFEENEKVDGESYYDVTWINQSNNAGFQLEYSFSKSNYKDASSLKKCYEYINVIESGNILTISTSKKFTCFDEYSLLDSFTINITTLNKVSSNNADSANNNIYTWNITKSNASNKPVSITINTNSTNEDPDNPDPVEPVEPTNEKPEVEIWHIILIIILVLGLLIIAIVPKILSSRSKK